MEEDLEVLKEYVELLKLDSKNAITKEDKKELADLLEEADEHTLAKYVRSLPDLSEFIVELYS